MLNDTLKRPVSVVDDLVGKTNYDHGGKFVVWGKSLVELMSDPTVDARIVALLVDMNREIQELYARLRKDS